MIVCIDSGNSRIKWGVHDGSRWLARAALAQAEVHALAELTRLWPSPSGVFLANVAGDAAAGRIRQALAGWPVALRELKSTASACGVINLYDQPTQLGVDRWCALVGARGVTTAPCLVVMAGTATTVDALDADGRFLGGLILPGLDLMRRALARDTAGLPFAKGRHHPFPRCTDDAIVSGAIEAQLGAIERAYRRLDDPAACCLLSGGNAGLLAPELRLPVRLVEDLPLEGLCRLAMAAQA